MVTNNIVGIADLKTASYPKHSPFHPHLSYPEYPHKDFVSTEQNIAYEGVRELFKLLKLDIKHVGKSNWNPLGKLIKPGMTVVLKPNFVLSFHSLNKDIYSIITHPAVIRAVADYCIIALKGKGKLIIADAPQYNCNWEELMSITKLPETISFLKSQTSVNIELLDLREYWATKRHFPSYTKKLVGDPKGKILVNLGRKSMLASHLNPLKFYGAVYNRQETIKHHIGNHQEYEISKTVLNADVLINLPKLKVHKKVGVTLNQKNLVGICTNKNYLVHYTLGLPHEGGDQFPEGTLSPKLNLVIKFERWMYDHFLACQNLFGEYMHRFIYGFWYLRVFSRFGFSIPEKVRVLDAGNWYGNDSAWRMVTDLAIIVSFCDRKGKIQKNHQRKTFSVVDGIIGGDNLGPLEPDPHPSGVIIGGDNFLYTDVVATRLMGFDSCKIKQFSGKGFNKIKIVSNNKRYITALKNKNDRYLRFLPHPGWVGHIEI